MGSAKPPVTIRSEYDRDLPGIVTHLVGPVGIKEVQEWALSFRKCRDLNFLGRGFKLLVNTYGYEPESPNVHQMWRSSLVEVCQNRCHAIAFVNHDPMKVFEMQKTATRTHQFFLDIDDAYQWLVRNDSGLPKSW